MRRTVDSAAEIRSAFQKRADAGYIESVTGKDVDVVKNKNEITASASWTRKLPLAGKCEPAARLRGHGHALTRGQVLHGCLVEDAAHRARVTELGFAFRRPELVRQALTHRSFGAPHNERLGVHRRRRAELRDRARRCSSAFRRFRRASCRACAQASSTATRWRGSRARCRSAAMIRLGEGEVEERRCRAAVDSRRRARGGLRRSIHSTAVSTSRGGRSRGSMPPSARRSRSGGAVEGRRRRGCRSGCRRAARRCPEYA